MRTVVVLDHPEPDGLDAGLLGGAGRLVDASGLGVDETHRLCRDADVIVTDAAPVDADLIGRLRRCRTICEYGTGVDNIDVAAATAAGIHVTSVPAYCVDELADHALALILAATRGIVRYDRDVHRGRWDYRAAAPLSRMRGSTLGIVGLGKVGLALAARAAPLGLRVIAADPLATGAAPVELVPLPQLLTQADVVSLHAPLTADTYHLIDADRLAAMKPTAYLVNTARGGLVDQAALLAALRTGQLAGAALDVLATEPPAPHEPLLDLPNVIVTPHAGFYSEQSIQDLTAAVFTEVRAALRGEAPLHPVNRIR